MKKALVTRNRLIAAAALIFLFIPAAVPAHAVSKEIVELQTQVQQLLDMVQRLQSTLDSHFGVMQNLAEKTADAANQVDSTVNALQQKLNSQGEAVSGKVDTVSGQVQSLNDSVDELKSRIAKLDKSVQDLQAQLQTMQQQAQAAQSGAMTPGGSAMPGVAQGAGQGQGPGMAPGQAPGQVPGSMPNSAGGPAPSAPGAPQAPPLQETLQAAQRDFDAGRYKVAASEFEDIVHYYPLDDQAGTAQFYLGEIAYQQKDYATAINDYNYVLEGFSGNAKAPAAQLHKAYSLLAMDKKQAGIDELRELVRRHPQTPEAHTARTKLNAMGVRLTPER
ncbi:MAG: tetratricopeptide repeat protein [Terracidiphilus sp.]